MSLLKAEMGSSIDLVEGILPFMINFSEVCLMFCFQFFNISLDSLDFQLTLFNIRLGLAWSFGVRLMRSLTRRLLLVNKLRTFSTPLVTSSIRR
jgi:hypothetical protein